MSEMIQDNDGTKFYVKRIGGVAAVALLDVQGRVISVCIHRFQPGGDPCSFLGGAGCYLSTSYVSDSVEGRRVSPAELDKTLRYALRSALMDRDIESDTHPLNVEPMRRSRWRDPAYAVFKKGE